MPKLFAFSHIPRAAFALGFTLCAAGLRAAPGLAAPLQRATNAPAASFASAAPAPLASPSALPTSAAPAPSAAPPTPRPSATAVAPPAALPPQAAPPPPAGPAPTAVPIIVDPPSATVQLGGVTVLRARGVFGRLDATTDHPERVSLGVDQNARTIAVYGRAAGHASLALVDQRGERRTVEVYVAPVAGAVASYTSVDLTGSPASAIFIAETARQAAVRAARPAPGAVAVAAGDIAASALDIDRIRDVYVPITITGPGLYPVSAATVVRVRNVAEPPVPPSSLIVSDFPERLTASGLLFSGAFEGARPARLLFYHYNPKGQPDRRIVLRVTNSRDVPATVQLTRGHGGPQSNEMAVGHAATERFLVRALQNEATLRTIPARGTVALVDAPLPAGTIVNDILQLREIDGARLDYTLTAEDAATGPIDGDTYLTANEHHARGVYPIPQFFYETTYRVGMPPIAIPVGQLPLPNLRVGEALAGDYGVQMTIDASLVNATNAPATVAVYANPRGGRATGTFIVDRALVRAHALPSFSTYKIRRYLVPAHGVVNVQIITMPEGGSSYPLELLFGPDDGTVAPGAPGSPMY